MASHFAEVLLIELKIKKNIHKSLESSSYISVGLRAAECGRRNAGNGMLQFICLKEILQSERAVVATAAAEARWCLKCPQWQERRKSRPVPEQVLKATCHYQI